MPTKVRPELPRLAELLRLLLWFQFYAALMLAFAALVVGGVLSSPDGDDSPVLFHLFLMMLLLFAIDILLALAAASVRRRWKILYPLVLIGEAGVVYVTVYSLATGLFVWWFGIALLLLGGLILADLFRGEVWTHMRRRV